MCCGPWGLEESDTTERLNRTESMDHFKHSKNDGTSPHHVSTL